MTRTATSSTRTSSRPTDVGSRSDNNGGREDTQRTEELSGEQDVAGEAAESGTEAMAGEADVLRAELLKAQERLSEAQASADEFRDRYLRSRADLENYRRRALADAQRAKAAGIDAAVSTVLRVFDDLQRAIAMADEDVEEAELLPGVRVVLRNLEDDMQRIGITRLGEAGEQFDPSLHEALTAVPATPEHPAGTIAQVVTVGFAEGERLIRPASVVVYND